MSELDLLFKDVKPITSELDANREKVKGENQMSFMKTLGNVVTCGALLGLAGMGLQWYIAADGASEEVSGNTTEEQVLAKVQTYCFPSKLPIIGKEKDVQTCKLWLLKYRGLTEYKYSDPEESEQTASADKQGNAQSPAQ